MIPGLGRTFGEAKGYLFYFFFFVFFLRDSLIAQLVKNLPAMKETPAGFLVREDLLEKASATYSSILGLPLWLSWEKIRQQCRRPGFYSWVWKIPKEGKSYPLQYSGLENSMDCTVHEKSQTLLSDFLQTFNT